MNKQVKTALIVGAIVAVITFLATRELTPKQEEALAFEKMCRNNPELQVCIDFKNMYLN